jgi:hypothetical protein
MNMKKTAGFILCLALSFSLAAANAPAAGALPEPAPSVTAVPSDVTLTLDGKPVQLDAYQIGGSNYFKLRDLAYILSDTEKRFSVTWDEETRTAGMETGGTYSPVGGEATLSTGYRPPREALPTAGAILLDGYDTDFLGYTIEGTNYFKLRDIMSAANVGVSWNEAERIIALDTSEDYMPDSVPLLPGTTPLDTEAIAAKAASVVTIYTYNEMGEEVSQGSGFFIRENGWIASCYHVFADPSASVVAVTDDGKKYAVHSVLGYDVSRDLILVKANGITGATPLALGSAESLRRGQPVVVISSPYNMKNSISSGIVSGFRTDVKLRSEGLTDIQITVPVSRGSSGGPLFDMYGSVRAIIYAKHLFAENANFAIPIGDLYSFMEHLSPTSFEAMREAVEAAAPKEAQEEPSSLSQSAAASYIR